jgi:transposase
MDMLSSLAMWGRAEALEVSAADQVALEALVGARRTPQKIVLRARIALGAAAGEANSELARSLGTSRPTVLLWRGRYAEAGIPGLLYDAPRPGRHPRISAAKVQAIVEATLQTTPRNATHWSTRTMARAQGISEATVRRIWHAHGLQPHRVETFKLSRDPAFVTKLRDIVGLYLNPPDKALVLCVDEKSQIQALDRTQPVLPLRPGVPARQTHDYIRHGTTTLFAALNVLDGKVIGTCMPRHRHTEFLAFLERIERATPKRRAIHLIVDNYGTHKHPSVRAWLAVHPRFHLHFTPTGASWLNLVERWFAEITRQRIRRGTFRSVPDLIRAIQAYLQEHNQNPRPFLWTASVKSIMRKIRRCKEASDAGH